MLVGINTWIMEIIPSEAGFDCCTIPARVLKVERALTRLFGKDLLHENAILLNFAILCCKLRSACFGCICC